MGNRQKMTFKQSKTLSIYDNINIRKTKMDNKTSKLNI